jgi:alanine dehydrogenase
MHKESGEVRDFFPDLLHGLAQVASGVVIEEGSGSGMGIESSQYVEEHSNIRIGSNQDCYDQDIVVQVRSPEKDELGRMKSGTILFSMLHYSTHPRRIQLMSELGHRPISMDSVVGDDGRRLIEHLRGTSWNAVRAGFRALKKTCPTFADKGRKPIEVVIVGAGPVGRFAAEAATKYGDATLNKEFLGRGVPGVIVHLIGRNITQDETALRTLFQRADMIVDATSRTDPARHIIANYLIGALPQHAVVLDATVDPYITDIKPIRVKAIEGIPTGNLDLYEFPPDHPAFDRLPEGVSSDHRRMTVSCYSWPGTEPKKCMKVYGRQMLELLKILLEQSYEKLSLENTDFYMRALYRGTLEYYRHHQIDSNP